MGIFGAVCLLVCSFKHPRWLEHGGVGVCSGAGGLWVFVKEGAGLVGVRMHITTIQAGIEMNSGCMESRGFNEC